MSADIWQSVAYTPDLFFGSVSFFFLYASFCPMKAIAVKPRQPNSVHLADLPKPRLEDVPNGRGVLVKVLKVGVDATDREINEGLYGAPPPGYKFLVIGHESFGIVEAIGPNVRHVKPGDYVSCTVRRPGGSIYDRIGRSDITSEETYYERGINLLHGFMTEHFVDDAEFIVHMPRLLTSPERDRLGCSRRCACDSAALRFTRSRALRSRI
jgi:threonine dehydrogenase-like Zn-dependent dehydrogenase